MPHLLSFGHGYSAQGLGAILPDGWTLTGTTRKPERAEKIAALGAYAVIWPGSDLSAELDKATHILISTAPDENGDPVLGALRDEITARAGQFEWVGYLSTTGIYGDHQGGWVDETTPVNPVSKRGMYRANAENQWMELHRDTGLPVHIFRLSGIYGPGRGPFEKVKRGTAQRVIKENQYFSRTHVDDIAQVLLASINRPNAGSIYNVCDDLPVAPQDVIGYAAELLGVPLPPEVPFEEADMTPMARSFYGESKKVRNDKIKTELGVTLIHPTYREGLESILASEG